MSPPAVVLDSALGAVGNTPLIRLDRLAHHEGLKCNLLGKLEYTSAGGSVKDRIAKRMVEAAEAEGKLVPGKSVVIEPTSGNTGIGLAMACAIKGYAVIIVMPQKMSLEKEAALRALGAEVVRTPTEAAWDSPESHIGVAARLQREIPGGIILDQYRNVNNPLAHEFSTGPEIIEAVVNTPSTPEHPSSGKVDVLFAGAGTGGTVSGIAKAIKKAHNPDCIVVGVDPVGSILALPSSLNGTGPWESYIVEGIGYDFVPEVLSREPGLINHWVKTNDKDAFAAVRELMRREGTLVGGSSGSSLAGALAWLRSDAGKEVAQTEGKNVVVLLPDGIRNYIGKDWFLKMALEAEPTPLAQIIKSVLARPTGQDQHANGLKADGTKRATNGDPCNDLDAYTFLLPGLLAGVGTGKISGFGAHRNAISLPLRSAMECSRSRAIPVNAINNAIACGDTFSPPRIRATHGGHRASGASQVVQCTVSSYAYYV
ncbi:unnamed protein product [Peniophora sp. CBMAI 1063]|nr:unnamed protein product [Peniophora sp. CBMAI 1063]